MRIALATVAASLWLHDAAAQSPPAVPARGTNAEPVLTPLTAPWTFPDSL
jgi:hypothetical protein